MKRAMPMPWLAAGSLVALVMLVALLFLESRPPGSDRSTTPLRLYCAASLRPVMEEISAAFENETGQAVAMEYGDSGRLLGQVEIRPDGDLFLPADDGYIRIAESKGLIARRVALCRMEAVLLCRPEYKVSSLADLTKPGIRLGIANPDRAAIGKIVRKHLAFQGKWDTLAARIDVQHFNVTDAANAVQLGSRDATFVWDVVAVRYPDLAVVRFPELAGAEGRVELALLNGSPNPEAAARFARYTSASDRGLRYFRKAGFRHIVEGTPWR